MSNGGIQLTVARITLYRFLRRSKRTGLKGGSEIKDVVPGFVCNGQEKEDESYRPGTPSSSFVHSHPRPRGEVSRDLSTEERETRWSTVQVESPDPR